MTPLAKAAGRFSETAIDDEVVVMNLDTGDFYSLTGTARAIWTLIDGTRTRADVLAALAAQYGGDTDADAMAAQLDAFVGDLRDAGLLAGA